MSVQFRAEVGKNANFNDSPVKWSDVSAAVMSGGYKRGKSTELDKIEAGEATVEFDDSDGSFTPGRQSWVKPRVPIRFYTVHDNNWLNQECVNATAVTAVAPRWSYSSTATGSPTVARGQVTTVTDGTLGRDVFEFTTPYPSGSVYFNHGLVGDADVIQVKANQTILISADLKTFGNDVTIDARGTVFGSTTPTFGGAGPAVTLANGWKRTEVWFTPTSDSWWRVQLETSGTGARIRAANLKVQIIDGYSGGVPFGGSLAAYLGLTTNVAAVSGVYPAFRGWVEKWTQEYSGTLSTVTATCVDGLAVVSQPLPTSYRSAVRQWYNRQSRATNEFLYWTCVESNDTTTAAPTYGDYSLSIQQGKLPPDTLGFTDTHTMVYADGMESGGFTVSNSDYTAPFNHQSAGSLVLVRGNNPKLFDTVQQYFVDLWFDCEYVYTGGGAHYLWSGVSTGPWVSSGASIINVQPDGGMQFKTQGYSNFEFLNLPAGTIVAGNLYHIGMKVYVQSAVMKIEAWINGVKVATSTGVPETIGIPPPTRAVFGASCEFRSDLSQLDNSIRGTINHVVYSTTADQDFHETVHPIGIDPTEVEDVRLNRVLDVLNWSGSRNFDQGLSTLLPARWEQETDARTLLDGTSESAGGMLFAGSAGEMVYRNRQRRMGAPVRWSLSEWSDGLRFELDAETVYNVITAERVTGLVRTVTDDDSVATYGPKTLKVTRDVNDPDEVLNGAYWLLHRYADSIPRCDTLTVEAHTLNGSTDGPLIALAYGAGLSDRLQLAGLPATAPADSIDFFIEGLSVSFTLDGSVLTWDNTLSVSDARQSDAWILEDNTSGLLDTDYCVAVY